jgi:hypothetical protein
MEKMTTGSPSLVRRYTALYTDRILKCYENLLARHYFFRLAL